MAAGLLQYYFFPTDYYYPLLQSNNTAGKPLIVSMETQKRDDDEDHGIDQKHHQSKLMISKASVSTISLIRSPCVIKADHQLRSKRLNPLHNN
ncbi:hypothetical protein Ddye_011834 [Dipteronia dyeriana]|uniref:Uncharacterized protein n=1 Tax=Dipteronia dyeriana TaxID=168575 RepID=A0AAD9X357_9ROSI|nr:hypothetical protein Ddye_011834 [Dipteronia dyeriana]